MAPSNRIEERDQLSRAELVGLLAVEAMQEWDRDQEARHA